MRIAVVGATGLVGRPSALQSTGSALWFRAPARQVWDLLTGEGLDDALDGVDARMDVTNAVSSDRGRRSCSPSLDLASLQAPTRNSPHARNDATLTGCDTRCRHPRGQVLMSRNTATGSRSVTHVTCRSRQQSVRRSAQLTWSKRTDRNNP
jgi:hypothetical protein